MNNEYVKIGKDKYVVTDEKGKMYKRKVNSPKLFEYENNVEIADNKIKSLLSQKNKISNSIKRKNIRNILCYIPFTMLWTIVMLKETVIAFSSVSVGIIPKILVIGMLGATIIADASVIGNTIVSNIEAKFKKEDIDKSLVIAKRLREGYKQELENFKLKSIIGIKDNTRENKRVSLKEKNEYKSFEIQQEILNYDETGNYKKNNHTLVRKR